MRPTETTRRFRAPLRVLCHASRIWFLPLLLVATRANLANAQTPQPVLSGGGTATIVEQGSSNLRVPNSNWNSSPVGQADYQAQSPSGSTVIPASAETQLPTDLPAEDGDARLALRPPSGSDGSEPPTKGAGTLQMFLSVGSSLLIVVGLFLGVAWCYRKTLSSSVAGALPKQVVNVLGRTPLAPRQQLVLVRFGSKLVLVSMVQGEARMISEITDPIEVDQLAGICESARPGSISQSFRNVLNQGAAS